MRRRLPASADSMACRDSLALGRKVADVCLLVMGVEQQGGMQMPCPELGGGCHAGAGVAGWALPLEQRDVKRAQAHG